MAKFELNKGRAKLTRQAEQVSAEAVKASARRGEGRPQLEVERIVREELTKRGITPGTDVGEIALRIAGYLGPLPAAAARSGSGRGPESSRAARSPRSSR